MVGEVLSLSKVRKGRARAEKSARAAANAAKFGRTKADRITAETAQARRAALLEAHLRNDPPAKA